MVTCKPLKLTLSPVAVLEDDNERVCEVVVSMENVAGSIEKAPKTKSVDELGTVICFVGSFLLDKLNWKLLNLSVEFIWNTLIMVPPSLIKKYLMVALDVSESTRMLTRTVPLDRIVFPGIETLANWTSARELVLFTVVFDS